MMDVPSGRWSTGAIMLVIVPVALELVLFQGVWTIVLIPPVTMALATLNLALFFALVRPRSWEARILGSLLGGLAAVLAVGVFYAWEFRYGPPGSIGVAVRDWLERRASSLADPGGGTTMLLRRIAHNTFGIEAGLMDLVGVAIIWAGGLLDRSLRRRRDERRATRTSSPPRVEPVPTS